LVVLPELPLSQSLRKGTVTSPAGDLVDGGLYLRNRG
jgi:hypothetical protein